MAKRKPKICRRYVDMWAVPGIHPSNVEFLQLLKSADTQHFTKNMNSIGTVKERPAGTGKWENNYLVGIRTDVWKPDAVEMARTLEVLQDKRKEELRREIKRHGRLDAKQTSALEQQLGDDQVMQLESDDIERRRLVLKLFKTTGKRVNWAGTIEEMTTTEIHNSLGSNRSMLTLAVMLPGFDFVTTLQQNHRTYQMPAIFSFCYLYQQSMYHVLLKRRWFAMGADFEVQIEGKTIGLIDGRMFGFGSDSYVNLSDHELSADSKFIDLLTLFAASIGYHQAMRKSVGKRVKANLAGEGHRHVIDSEELRLRHNGRKSA